jgi:hypothetical protein
VGDYSANFFGKNEVKLKIVENEPIESLETPWGFSKDSIGSTSMFFNNHGQEIRGNDPP